MDLNSAFLRAAISINQYSYNILSGYLIYDHNDILFLAGPIAPPGTGVLAIQSAAGNTVRIDHFSQCWF